MRVGKIYEGKVTSIKDFGAFIEILPGRDGLCHISELDDKYVGKVEEVCKVGDIMQVKVIAIDDQDRVKLSRKALLREQNPRPARRRRPRAPRLRRCRTSRTPADGRDVKTYFFIPAIHSRIRACASASTTLVANGGMWPSPRCAMRCNSAERSGWPGATRRASSRPKL